MLTRFFSYKVHSENCQAENCRKSKNILRMFGGSNSIQHRNLSMNLHKIWWCLLLTLHFYVKTILNTALYLSLSLYIHSNPHSIIYLLYVPSNWNGKYLNFFCLYIPQKTGVSTKNVLRMFEAHFWKKYKNVEPRWKNHHSY